MPETADICVSARWRFRCSAASWVRIPRAMPRKHVRSPSSLRSMTKACASDSGMVRAMNKSHPTIGLREGDPIPVVGLGVYQTPPGEVTQRAVLDALACGYRHIDTASIYENEKDVGIAIKKSELP